MTEGPNSPLDFIINAVLSFVTVVPGMIYACNNILFSYETNDDCSVAEILSGAYTGTPNAHGIMISYPISGIISYLYKTNPVKLLWFWPNFPNWYIAYISIISIMGMVFVLFKLLKNFSCNRILVCILFTLPVGCFWLGCFTDMTFSTAAAFLGCISMMLLAFEVEEDLWKPWNLLLFAFYFTMAWSLRKPCAYMVLPFIAIILAEKYQLKFLKSWKPWCIVAVIAILMIGLPKYNGIYYSSNEWKEYYTYTRERSYVQDYTSIPKYEDNKEFYDSLGIDDTEISTMRSYSYCIVDDFKPEWFRQIYAYVKSQETPDSYYQMARKLISLRRSVYSHITEPEKISNKALKASIGIAILISLLFVISIIIPKDRSRRKREAFINFVYLASFIGLIYAEWAYLLYKGRFPRRVEETIWLLSLSALLVVAVHFIVHFKEKQYFRIPLALQLVILAIFIAVNPLKASFQSIQSRQLDNSSLGSAVEMVHSECAKNQDNIYVIDTSSFYEGASPYVNISQRNIINTGGWRSYSPLYYEKLEYYNTANLGSDFLLRDNVYLIMKENKSVAAKMGLNKKQVQSEIIDIMQKNDVNYKIVKVLYVNKEDSYKDI